MLVSEIFFALLLYLLEFSEKSVANPVSLVAEVSTLRRHMQSSHKGRHKICSFTIYR